MNDQKTPRQKPKDSEQKSRRLGPEEWVAIAGLVCLTIFAGIILFLFIPLLTHKPLTAALPPAIIEAAATRGFVLPPTWTPAPTEVVIATGLPTQVYDGSAPTRMYTPRPTSLPGLPLVFNPQRLATIDVIDLARILQGESPGDKEAAYYVGWVAKNRLLHPYYGDTFAHVSSGFFGYRADIQPSEDFLEIARRVIRAPHDPTGGCLYALSRTDITNLGVPASRADVHIGEWFFFRTWPVGGYY
ncbi:MAG: hypothetical protein KDJ97_06635 [Anaerolineae bacterium]|nr:hypothetical protein [Anaerolineae bacterium]